MGQRLLLISLVFCLAGWVTPIFSATQQEQALRKITFPSGTTIEAEIADTLPKRQLGLMFRKSLANDRGMLFIFEKPDFYRFWMKNCRFPIDIIWLDEHKRIVYIKPNVPPCLDDLCPTFGSPKKASYVIEAVAGFANEQGLKPDMEVKF